MGATNKTPIMGLPQFIETDKPSWLTDVNSAFQTIDTGYAKIDELGAATADLTNRVNNVEDYELVPVFYGGAPSTTSDYIYFTVNDVCFLSCCRYAFVPPRAGRAQTLLYLNDNPFNLPVTNPFKPTPVLVKSIVTNVGSPTAGNSGYPTDTYAEYVKVSGRPVTKISYISYSDESYFSWVSINSMFKRGDINGGN